MRSESYKMYDGMVRLDLETILEKTIRKMMYTLTEDFGSETLDEVKEFMGEYLGKMIDNEHIDLQSHYQIDQQIANCGKKLNELKDLKRELKRKYEG